MHAMVVVIKLDVEEEALRSLKDDVIPQMQQAPGFSTGTWFGNEQKGHALVLFDTEEHARQAAPPASTPMPGGMVLSCDIYPVTGQA